MSKSKHNNHIKWAKKRTSILLAIAICIIFWTVALIAGGKFVHYFLDQVPPTITQEESRPARTCYFMSIRFMGTDQNGAELEITEIPAECPPSHKPRRD